MPRTKGINDIKTSKTGAIFTLKENIFISSKEIAHRLNYDEKTIKNTLIRIYNLAEKENASLLQIADLLYIRDLTRPGRPVIINNREI